MNGTEFESWMKTLESELPQICGWLKKHRPTIGTWERDLSAVELQDAVDALVAMRQGITELPPAHEWQSFPRYVVAFCQASQVPPFDGESRFSGVFKAVTEGPQMGLAFRRAVDARRDAADDGRDPEAAARAAIREVFGDDEAPSTRDAYRCLLCRDAGYVTCWAVHTMGLARRHVKGEIERSDIEWKTCGVSCSCGRGRQTWVSGGRRKAEFELPIYNADEWVAAEAGEESLLEWAENWRPSNYVDFGEYSAN